MALRLAGETPGVVQGLDGQGWPQMASPGGVDLRVGLLRRPRTGTYMLHPYHALQYTTGSNTALAADSLRAMVPMDIPERWEFDGIEVHIVVAGDAGAEVRLGLYQDDGSGVYPGALEFDAGFVAADSTGVKSIALSPTKAVSPGRYYLALLAKSVTTMPQIRDTQNFLPLLGVNYILYPESFGCIGVSQAYGALPDPFPSGGSYIRKELLKIAFKLASVG
jgi:hypothetical protein